MYKYFFVSLCAGFLAVSKVFASEVIKGPQELQRQKEERELAQLNEMPKVPTPDLIILEPELPDILATYSKTYLFHRSYVVFSEKKINVHINNPFKFYDNPQLKGAPLFRLEGQGIYVNDTQVCGLHIPKKKVFTKSWVVCTALGCGQFDMEKPVEKEVLDLNAWGFYELPSKNKPCRYGYTLRRYTFPNSPSGWYSPQAKVVEGNIVLQEKGKSYFTPQNDCKGEGCYVVNQKYSAVEDIFLARLRNPKEQKPNKDRQLTSAQACLKKHGGKCWDWFRSPKNKHFGEAGCATNVLQPTEEMIKRNPDCDFVYEYFEWSDFKKEEFMHCLEFKSSFRLKNGKKMYCMYLYSDETPLGEIPRAQNVSNMLPESVGPGTDIVELGGLKDVKEFVWSLEE